MGSESIAYEAEGRMGYWLRGHESERNSCFSKIQLVGQKYQDKTPLGSKNAIHPPLFWWAIIYSPVVAQPITAQH